MITGLELASSIVYGNPKCDVSLYITYNTEENKYELIYNLNGYVVFELPIKENHLTILYNSLKHETESFCKKYHIDRKLLEEDPYGIKLEEIDNSDDGEYNYKDIKVFLDSNFTLTIGYNTYITIKYYNSKLYCYNEGFSHYDLDDEKWSELAVNVYAIILMNRIESFIKEIDREGIIQ